MKNLYFTVGIIGSGKSTVTRELLKTNRENHDPNTILVSDDDIRTMINGGEYRYDESQNRLVDQLVDGVIQLALQEGIDIIVDMPYLTKIKRQKLINRVRVYDRLNFYLDNDKNRNIIALEFQYGPWCLSRRLESTRGLEAHHWQRTYEEMIDIFEPVGPSEDCMVRYYNCNNVDEESYVLTAGYFKPSDYYKQFDIQKPNRSIKMEIQQDTKFIKEVLAGINDKNTNPDSEKPFYKYGIAKESDPYKQLNEWGKITPSDSYKQYQFQKNNRSVRTEMQRKYCLKNNVPMFAPQCCPRCKRDVFGLENTEIYSTTHIVSCPLCENSFCD